MRQSIPSRTSKTLPGHRARSTSSRRGSGASGACSTHTTTVRPTTSPPTAAGSGSWGPAGGISSTSRRSFTRTRPTTSRPGVTTPPSLDQVVRRARSSRRSWLGGVESPGRDVVGRVRVKERREVLDMPPAGPQLPLPAAVGGDVVGRTVVVCVEQAPDAPEPRRLDVDRARWPGSVFDVLDGMDWRIPRHASRVRLEDRPRLVRYRWILDPSLGEPFDYAAIEIRVGWEVDGSPLVSALEVDRVHRPGRREVLDEPVVPGARRVELEPQAWVEVEPRTNLVDGLRIGEALRGDERDGAGRAPDCLGERLARLAQCEIERRALEGPAAVVP